MSVAFDLDVGQWGAASAVLRYARDRAVILRVHGLRFSTAPASVAVLPKLQRRST